MVLALVFLGEGITMLSLAAIVLIGVGTIMT